MGGLIFHTITHPDAEFPLHFKPLKGLDFQKNFPGETCPWTPLADQCLDIHVQPPSPENTLCPSFDVKTVSCNMSENLQFSVKREKHFLVAVNCESEEFFYGGRGGGGLFFEN